jgi:hypothetical protein
MNENTMNGLHRADTAAVFTDAVSAEKQGGLSYILKITLIEGPITHDFALKNPEVSRTLRIHGDRTLEDLHREIFQAFDRTSERPYEFQFEHDSCRRKEACYILPAECRDIYGEPIKAGDVHTARIDSLCLSKGDRFNYYFDFLHNWLHRIEVRSIDGDGGDGVIERVGESPAQFPETEKVIRV